MLLLEFIYTSSAIMSIFLKPPYPCIRCIRRFLIVPDEEFLEHKAAHTKACHSLPFFIAPVWCLCKTQSSTIYFLSLQVTATEESAAAVAATPEVSV